MGSGTGWHPHVEYKQRHGDREYAITQRSQTLQALAGKRLYGSPIPA
jgi:hypothetical protein